MPATATQQDLTDAFQELYDALTQAYWAASTLPDKDLLRGAADAIYDVLTELEEQDLKAGSAQYVALQANVDKVTAKLNSIKCSIDSFMHNVAVATSVTNAIVKALDASAKYFV